MTCQGTWHQQWSISEAVICSTPEYFSTFRRLGFLYQGPTDPAPSSFLPYDVVPELLEAGGSCRGSGPHSWTSMELLTSLPLCQCLALRGLHHSAGGPGDPPPYPRQLPTAHLAFSGAQGLGNLQLAVVQLGEPQGHQTSELTTQSWKVGSGREGK